MVVVAVISGVAAEDMNAAQKGRSYDAPLEG